jgi:hypothetical protein
MAYNFNGTNQYLTMASAIVSAEPITMACWFKTGNTTAAQNLICINSSTNNSRHVLQARGDVAGDIIRAQSNNGGFGNADTSVGYSSNTWTHAAGVFAASNSRTAYINGGASGTNSSNISAQNLVQSSIAAQRFSGFANGVTFFSGDIAEVGIWNAALTAEEIASLAKGMTCDKVRPQSLVFYAPLVRDLQDVRGGLTITNNNTATVANHPRVYA